MSIKAQKISGYIEIRRPCMFCNQTGRDPRDSHYLCQKCGGTKERILYERPIMNKSRALGRRSPSNKPALKLADFLTGQIPAHPVAADHFGNTPFGLYGNDQYGVCGPTSVANLIRLVSVGLSGNLVQPSQNDVFDLYKRSGNPTFDPTTDVGDNGVDMQTMLEALLSGGIGDGKGGNLKPVAFAKVDPQNDQEVDAAVSIFGGTLWGVDLEVAQQTQSDQRIWDYSKSADWGGHAVLNGAYENNNNNDVISWAERIAVTDNFRNNQLQEVWVVVWPWNISKPAFQQGIDLNALANAYQALTGKPLPLPAPAPIPPTPSPTPTPAVQTVDQFIDKAVAGFRAYLKSLKH